MTESFREELRDMLELAASRYSRVELQSMLDEIYKDREQDKMLPSKVLAQGTHGSCSWVLNKEGTLRIYPTDGLQGTLAEQSIVYNSQSPWKEYHNDIAKVVVSKGVSTGKNANSLFAFLDNCKEMDLTGLDTSKSEQMSALFYDCRSLTLLNLDNLSTQNALDLANMFNGCEKLTDLQMRNLNVDKAMIISGMFNGCLSLTNLEIGNADLTKVPRKEFVFANCDKLANKEMALKLGGTKMELPDFLKNLKFPTKNISRNDSRDNVAR